jgi:hypothetical protein
MFEIPKFSSEEIAAINIITNPYVIISSKLNPYVNYNISSLSGLDLFWISGTQETMLSNKISKIKNFRFLTKLELGTSKLWVENKIGVLLSAEEVAKLSAYDIICIPAGYAKDFLHKK